MATSSNSENILNSSDYKDLVNSITSTKKNKILLDNICNWYLFEGQIILGFNILKKYENIFKSNLVDYTVPKDYMYRPEYVSYTLYGTTDLWYLILFVNDMGCVDEFTKETIKVFDYNIIDTINNIINTEMDLISTRTNPRYIQKHFLKNLDEPSDDILGDDYYKETNFIKNPSFDNRLSDLLKYKYKMSERMIVKGELKDDNDEVVNPFEIMNGIYNIPSCYYKEGYENTYKGKVSLDSSKTYNLLQLYNGNVKLVLKDIDDNIILNIVKDFDFGEYYLINDFREANELNEKLSFDKKKNRVNFVEKNGRYSLEIKGNYNKGKANLYKYTISSDDLERLNLNRLLEKDCIFIDVTYSSLYNTEKINFTGYSVACNYTDSSQEVFECTSDNSSLYMTGDIISELKIAVQIDKSKTLKSIQIISNLNTLESTNFKMNLFSIKMTGYNYDEITVPFTVPNSAVYNIEMTYNYDYKFRGLYFEPKIIESTKKDSQITYNPEGIDSYFDYIESIPKNVVIDKLTDGKIRIDVPIDGNYETEKWLNIYSTDLQLPNEYILTFNTSLMTSKGGSVMFVFDSPNDEEGYALIISSNKSKKNSKLPDFMIDNKFTIAETGFYKLTKEPDAKKYYIFDKDRYYFFTGTEIKRMSTIDIDENKVVNGKDLRIVKKYNRIKMYRKDDKTGEFLFKYPILDLKDESYFFMNGGLRFVGLFAGNRTDLIDYYPYE